MTPEFDIKLTDKDLFRFNMRQNYTSLQGPISIVLAILFGVIAGIVIQKGNLLPNGVLYIAASLVFLFYVPVTLLVRSKRTIKKNKVLSGTLHYSFTETGLCVSQNGETGELPYDQFFKVVATKKQLLIFSNRINAYIIPRNQMEQQYPEVRKLLLEKVENYRLKVK